MKHNPEEIYKEKWRGIKLSAESRARMEQDLLEYACYHSAPGATEEGVRNGELSRSIERVPQNTFGISLTRFSNFRFKHMTALILIALLAGGGTSFAAERAVPGDALYPMKVEVNEEVKGWLAFSNDAEARLHARLMEERLEEAEALAAEGKLTAEAAADISARMNAHAKEAGERSTKAEAKGDLETAASVRASLQGMLASHARVLGGMNGDAPNIGMAELMKDIHAIASGDAEANVNADVEAGARTEIEATLDAAADLLDEAREDFEDVESELTASVKADAEARLTEGARIYADAQASLAADAYETAYTGAQTVMRIANEVRSMIKGALNFKIELDTETDTILNNVIKVESNTGGKGSNSGDDVTTSDASASSEVKVETDTDASIDAGIIKTNSSIKTNTGIGL